MNEPPEEPPLDLPLALSCYLHTQSLAIGEGSAGYSYTACEFVCTCVFIHVCILQQNALRRDCNGKCIELMKGHYLVVMVEV